MEGWNGRELRMYQGEVIQDTAEGEWEETKRGNPPMIQELRVEIK